MNRLMKQRMKQRMKQVAIVFSLSFTMAVLSGCAASYIQYDVRNSSAPCLPTVRAEAALGITILVNDSDSCSKKPYKPSQNTKNEDKSHEGAKDEAE